MKKLMRKILILICACTIVLPSYADDSTTTTPEPYTDDEFPQFMKDARRAEIITLGAMPFVTLNATFGYSFVRYCQHDFSSDYFPNPFSKTSSYTEDEQKTILFTAIGISVGIGLTDLIVSIVKRNIKKQKLLRENTGPIQITPIEQDEDAVQLPLPPPPPDGGDGVTTDAAGNGAEESDAAGE
ncbi:MAG TPA: hypothetical protein DCL73_09130 [Treponema sp.]|nr:hypothetical protein [Treponema sp.]